jgi:hypothetical protein
MFRSIGKPEVLLTTLAAAGILMITMGGRQSLGLFIAPLDASTGLGIATISLALGSAITPFMASGFGLTLLSHQIGGFLGAYLGGLAISRYGDYTWMWYADMALATFAALVNLPIREAPVVRLRNII